jgi:hypothetical protein
VLVVLVDMVAHSPMTYAAQMVATQHSQQSHLQVEVAVAVSVISQVLILSNRV